jgi:hypothetical protein
MQQKIKPKALKIALDAFRADPSLGARQAKSLFSEIITHLQAGMSDEAVLQEILNKNRQTTLPTGTLSLF